MRWVHWIFEFWNWPPAGYVAAVILIAGAVGRVLTAKKLRAELRERFPEEPPVARALRFGDAVLGWMEQLALFSLLVFVVFVTVLSFLYDHLGDRPLVNAHSDIRYACFLLAMIGGAYAAHHRRLLAMDFVSHFLPVRIRTWTRIVNSSFAAFMCAIFVYYANRVFDIGMEEMSTKGPTEHWMPQAWAASAMQIGGGLLCLHLVVQIVIDLDYLLRGRTPPEPQMGAA